MNFTHSSFKRGKVGHDAAYHEVKRAKRGKDRACSQYAPAHKAIRRRSQSCRPARPASHDRAWLLTLQRLLCSASTDQIETAIMALRREPPGKSPATRSK